MNRIALTIFYYIRIVPAALLLKLAGTDPLDRRPRKSGPTWRKRPH